MIEIQLNKWRGLERGEEAAINGFILAYFRNGIIFSKYKRNGFHLCLEKEKVNIDTFKDLLELHLYNEEKEYRAVFSEARNAFIEAVVTKEEEQKSKIDILEEEILLEETMTGGMEKTIKIINHLTYDERDMVQVNNYRMCSEGE